MLYANEQSFIAFLPSMMCVFLSWASFWIKLSIGWVTNDLLLIRSDCQKVLVELPVKPLLALLWGSQLIYQSKLWSRVIF